MQGLLSIAVVKSDEKAGCPCQNERIFKQYTEEVLHLGVGGFGFDRVEWTEAFGVRHQSEAHQFLAEFPISLIMGRGCSDYQSIKERNCDDFNKSNIKCL